MLPSHPISPQDRMKQIDCENISDLATAEAAQLSEHLVTDSLLGVALTHMHAQTVRW